MTSTSFNVGMNNDRSSSKKNKSNESESSDSESDEDYVPSTRELKDNDVASEDDSDGSDEEGADGGHDEGGKSGKRSKMSRKNPKKQKRTAVETGSESEPEKEEPPANIDDIWNEFKKDCGVPTVKKQTTVVENEDSKLETSSSSHDEPIEEKPKTKTVTELFEFAGEAVEVKKEVPIDAPEPPTIIKRPASTSRAGNLASVLGQIGKKNKLSVLEKSKLDWQGFKEKEGIVEDLQKHNKGKDGYLEKQDFLQRADLRQFEIEKAMRSSKRPK